MCSENELKERLEKLLSEGMPSSVVLEILEYENKHVNYMATEFKGYIATFEHCFDLLVNVIYSINFFPKDHYPSHRGPQLLMLKNNVSSLFSGFERLKRGFYSDSLILFRVSYEALIRVFFMSFHPEDYEVTLIQKTPKHKRRFILTNFVKDELKVDWSFLYRVLSDFSHGSKHQTLTEIINWDKEAEPRILAFELKLDKDKMSMGINISYLLVWMYLKTLLELFIRPREQEFPQALLKRLVETEEIMGEIIQTFPNRLSRCFGEAELIFTKIVEKD